ncbi:MAG: hypothetical protein Kow0049_02670 [Stanieria sp.]
MNKSELITEKQLQLWLYLLPVIGIIPALWTISRPNSHQQQQEASRLCLILTFSWLLIYLLLNLGSIQGNELLAFRLLYLNALITTGYFLTFIFLMLRLVKGKSLYLPLISKLSNSIGRKY